MDRIELAQLARTGPNVVSAIRYQSGGVDFLGTRQLNLNFMQDVLPTVNNIVRWVRPYTVLAWAWWRAHELAKQAGLSVAPSDKMVRFVERVEVLFTWSHNLAGNARGLPGNTAKPPIGNGSVPLDLKSWKRPPGTATLMAPLQYGPSLKYPHGFRYIEPVAEDSRIFMVLEQALPAVHALDKRIATSSSAHLLSTLDPVTASEDEARALYDAWRVDQCEPIEATVFRERFSEEHWRAIPQNEGDSKWRRGRTVGYLVDLLRQSSHPMSVPNLRASLASWRLPDGQRWLANPLLEPAAVRFSLLQARQAQRQALELLLGWLEYELLRGGSRDLAALSQVAAQTVRHSNGPIAEASSFAAAGRILSGLADSHGGFPWGIETGEISLTGLSEIASEQARAKQFDLYPVTAIQLLTLAALLTRAHASSDAAQQYLEEGRGRVPLTTLLEILGREEPLEQSLHWIFADMVVSQHLVTAVTRNTDETQRLRLSLEEEGLSCITGRPLRPLPTPDRLENFLHLLADAMVCRRISDGKIDRFTVGDAAGSF
jgi:hypothetical protein